MKSAAGNSRSTDHSTPVDGILSSGLVGAAGNFAPALESAPLASVIHLTRTGQAITRPELAAASGLSRKVVTDRVDQALRLGLLAEGSLAPSAGGRQARTLRFRSEAGSVFAVLVGSSEITVAISDLAGKLRDVAHLDWPIERGPEQTLQRVRDLLGERASATSSGAPWGIGVGLPGPVDSRTGRLVTPPTMPGWDGINVRAWFRDHYDAPIWVENDVNLMALGESSYGADTDGRDLLFIKVGTGVGAGLISRGRLLRGERGAAGDIGHMRVTDDPRVVCRCGKTGCLEAVASGWSLLATATSRASESTLLADAIARRGHLMLGDIGEAAVAADPLAIELIEDGIRTIGVVTANLVNFANPGLLVLGGGILRTGPVALEVFTRVVQERTTDLASAELEIRAASLDFREGVQGAALLAAENLLAPATLTRWVEQGHPFGRGTSIQRATLDLT